MLGGLGGYIRQHHLALIALFVALSGTAYAAATIGADDIKKKAVRSKHIKRGNVKRSDLGANAVASAKVANRSLRLGDIVVAQGTRTIDPGPLLANQCAVLNATGGPFDRVRPGDVTVVFPRSLASGFIPYGRLVAVSGQGAPFVLCNTNDSAVDHDSDEFKVIVLR